MINLDLTGRVAVITGGTGGIGRAITKAFLEAGAKVVVWDLHVPSDLAPGVAGYVADATDETAVHNALSETMNAFGHIDILVNAAGLVGVEVLMEELTLAQWRTVMDVNLTSTFLCARAVIPGMRAQDYGRIINLASNAGKDCNPYQSAYSSAKAAVIGLTKSLGRELADTGIRVHAVSPALIETAMAKGMTEMTRTMVLAKIPMGRMGQPQEVASLVTWLASDLYTFSTGATHDHSGGRASF
jgi:NAD(P)-dependent dehydrogenase (short-subunit alcohol dehydrogenase family)